jgi:hypothetical protein
MMPKAVRSEALFIDKIRALFSVCDFRDPSEGNFEERRDSICDDKAWINFWGDVGCDGEFHFGRCNFRKIAGIGYKIPSFGQGNWQVLLEVDGVDFHLYIWSVNLGLIKMDFYKFKVYHDVCIDAFTTT